MSTTDQQTGIIKKFFPEKGYGFIKRDGPYEDVFVHISQLRGNGPRELTAGDRVSFDLADHERGLRAMNVRVLGRQS